MFVTSLRRCSVLLASLVLIAAEPAPSVVAHVSFVDGHATAALNAPVFAGDIVATGADGRAEVQFDATTAVRLAPNTVVRFVNVDPRLREMRVERGTLELRLFRKGGDGRVDAPTVALVAETIGRYRVDVGIDGRTELTVRSGRASIPLANGGVLALLPGRSLVAQGSPANPSISYLSSLAADDFDAWADSRDGSVASADTLAQYGQWMDYPGYGQIWSPFVSAGWTPYTQGSWMWTNYGATWVSSEPWGWTPYHYGRWFYDPSLGWAWVPGALAVWAPALVGYNTNGGWYPLAPNQPAQQPPQWWGWRARAGGPSIVTNDFVNYANAAKLYQNAHPGVILPPSKARFPLGMPAHVNPPVIMQPVQPPAQAHAVAAPPPPAPRAAAPPAAGVTTRR